MTEYVVYENHGYETQAFVSSHRNHDEAFDALQAHRRRLTDEELLTPPWEGGIRVSIVRATGDHEEAL